VFGTTFQPSAASFAAAVALAFAGDPHFAATSGAGGEPFEWRAPIKIVHGGHG